MINKTILKKYPRYNMKSNNNNNFHYRRGEEADKNCKINKNLIELATGYIKGSRRDYNIYKTLMYGARKVSELFRPYIFQFFIYLFFVYKRGNFRVQAL